MKMKEWVASYSSCQGGSPSKSAIWLVDILWHWPKGYAQTDEDRDIQISAHLNSGVLDSIKNGFCPPHDHRFDLTDRLRRPSSLNSTKLISTIMGSSVEEYPLFVAFSKNTDIFKLNLYPISLPSTEPSLWDKYSLAGITGISTRHEFEEYCARYRFPFFRSELEKHEPSVILCIGLTYLEQFERCFCDNGGESQLNREVITDTYSPKNSEPRDLYWKWLNEKTLFVAVPFMTDSSGLNSDNLLQQFGDRIKSILLEKDIDLTNFRKRRKSPRAAKAVTPRAK